MSNQLDPSEYEANEALLSRRIALGDKAGSIKRHANYVVDGLPNISMSDSARHIVQ